MTHVTHKTEIEIINGTPKKRMFWSIIADYDLKTGIFELIDNALDLWIRDGKKQQLEIKVELDEARQLVFIQDNAGGVKSDQLGFLIAPGASQNDLSSELIGVFGVGGKRAGVAIGEQVIIKTRFSNEKSCQLDITKDWLENEGWDLPAYEIPDIEPSTTIVEISHLRKSFSNEDIQNIISTIGETYSYFIGNGNRIIVNDIDAAPVRFNNWAYPPSHEPQSVSIPINYGKDGKVDIQITVGLILDRKPDEENYGVYFYCNNRLIVKELKTRDVGYHIRSEAGVPHPDASLCRAIVTLNGTSTLMPWNSSKSGLNFDHPVFKELRPTLIQLVSHFSSLSRRLKNNWKDDVFKYSSGDVHQSKTDGQKKKIVLPILPKVYKSAVEGIKTKNEKIITDMPWTLGLVEAVAAVDILERQRFDTKDRMSLILLDSNFEIALKEFIVHRTDLFPKKQYDDTRVKSLFGNRNNVIQEVTRKITIDPALITKAKHYYEMRNKLIHERATVGVTKQDIANYRSTIEQILHTLFGLQF